MRASRRSPEKMKEMKITRKIRQCNICGYTISIGQKYGKTTRGTTWCENCK